MYLLSGGGDRSDWVRNLVAEPRVQVRVGDRSSSATARIVAAGTDEDVVARRLLVAKYADPNKDDLSSWGRSALPVALDLDG